MSEALEWLDSIKKAQRFAHAARVKTVLTSEVPQHILATKELADDLTVGEDGYSRTEVGFYFKEKLVNRLMYLSYLHGKAEIDESSFRQGRDKAIQIMRDKLDEI